MSKFDELIKAVKGFISDTEVVALVLQDANGLEITFPDVADDASPIIGDMATIEGQPANGEYLSPTGETWVFLEGALTEVKPAVEETPEEEAARLEQERLDAEAATEDTLSAEQIQELLKETFASATKESNKALEAVKAAYDVQLAKIKSDNEAEIVALKKLIGSPEYQNEKDEKTKAKKSNSLATIFRG